MLWSLWEPVVPSRISGASCIYRWTVSGHGHLRVAVALPVHSARARELASWGTILHLPHPRPKQHLALRVVFPLTLGCIPFNKHGSHEMDISFPLLSFGEGTFRNSSTAQSVGQTVAACLPTLPAHGLAESQSLVLCSLAKLLQLIGLLGT